MSPSIVLPVVKARHVEMEQHASRERLARIAVQASRQDTAHAAPRGVALPPPTTSVIPWRAR